jgi:hypothetical protein
VSRQLTGFIFRTDQHHDESLHNYAILDSGATVHVFHGRSRFRYYKELTNQYLLAGDSHVRILGSGNVVLEVQYTDGTLRPLLLRNAMHCPDFATNVVSLRQLEKRGITWQHKAKKLIRPDGTDLCKIIDFEDQYVIERLHQPYTAFPARRTTWAARKPATGTGMQWHLRLGHLGKDALEHLVNEVTGAKINGPRGIDCDACAAAHAKRLISRRQPANHPTRPGQHLDIDFFSFTPSLPSLGSYTSVMLVRCRFSSMIWGYFLEKRKDEDVLAAIQDLVRLLKVQHSLQVETIRADNELYTLRPQLVAAVRQQGIVIQPSAPYTPAQNGAAEITGGIVIRRARAMRIGARLPEDLWPEIVSAAIYLANRSPVQLRDWTTPYELFYGYIADRDGIVGSQKPSLAHLHAYGCQAWPLHADVQKGISNRQKLKPRAWLGYLVGYTSTNIFRIWDPSTARVHSVRDVRFKENELFNRATYQPLSESLVEAAQELISRHEVLEPSSDSSHAQEAQETIEDTIVVAPLPSARDDDEPSDASEDEDEEPDEVQQQPTPEPSVTGVCNFLTNLVLETPPLEKTALWSLPPQGVVHQHLQTVFLASTRAKDHRPARSGPVTPESSILPGNVPLTQRRLHQRDLPLCPRNIKDARGHLLAEYFKQEEVKHLEAHDAAGTWETVTRAQANAEGQPVLGSMWVYAYKLDKQGYLVRCKARLVVRGDQQRVNADDTYAATLAMRSFRTLLALVARFDLETLQFDAVNAFLNADLAKAVYMDSPPGYRVNGKAKLLRKALFGLRESPRLWQEMLTSLLRSIGLQTIPEDPCIMRLNGIIVFFYVDDIVFAFHHSKEQEARQVINKLQKHIELTGGDEMKWFLGIQVIRDRQARKLWLSQATYCEKISKLAGQAVRSTKRANTPMTSHELMPNPGQATATEIRSYQVKIGSLLYAAVITRPDISFAVSRLGRFLMNPSPQHQLAADRVLLYLHFNRFLALEFGSGDELIISSDAAFADNTVDRKSSQAYTVELFGSLISWRANKQDTVTTSTTEAELLALSQAAREAIVVGRLLRDLRITMEDSRLIIQCDNTRAISLITDEISRLRTKLRHVDIHRHWLRQEVQSGRVHVRWVSTHEMPADGLTKALATQPFETFKRLVHLADVEQRITGLRAKEQ